MSLVRAEARKRSTVVAPGRHPFLICNTDLAPDRGVHLEALRSGGDDEDRAWSFDHGYLPAAIRRACREPTSRPPHDQDDR